MFSGSSWMRLLFLLCFPISAFCDETYGVNVATQISCEQTKVNWQRIRETFVKYNEDPSIPYALSFLDALPNKRVSSIGSEQCNEIIKTLDVIFSDKYYREFSKKVINGDKYAIEAAVRIHFFAEGGNGESILIILGDVLRSNPRQLLEVLYEHIDNLETSDLLGSAVMTKYPIGTEEERNEFKARLFAIRSIKDPKLLKMKDAYIMEINRALR